MCALLVQLGYSLTMASTCPSPRFMNIMTNNSLGHRYLVQEAVAIQKSVIDRCNLTALLEPGQEDTAEFLAVNKVHIIGDEFLDKTENCGHSYIFSSFTALLFGKKC